MFQATTATHTPDIALQLEVRVRGEWYALHRYAGTHNQARKLRARLQKSADALARTGLYVRADLRIVEHRQPRVKV